MNDQASDRWLVFELAEQWYAFNTACIQQLFASQELDLHRLPGMSADTEGVTHLRGCSVEVMDIRSLLGLPPLGNEISGLLELLEQRERDHVNWLTELESSVREKRPFTLTTDPHKCKFGLWYDSLVGDPDSLARFARGNAELIAIIERFDLPHKRIHAIGSRVTAAAAAGRLAEAAAIIEATRSNELEGMIRLFRRSRQLIQGLRNGLVIVLNEDGQLFGVMVDSIQRVARFRKEEIDPCDVWDHRHSLVIGVTHDQGASKMIQLLDARAVLHAEHAGLALA